MQKMLLSMEFCIKRMFVLCIMLTIFKLNFINLLLAYRGQSNGCLNSNEGRMFVVAFIEGYFEDTNVTLQIIAGSEVSIEGNVRIYTPILTSINGFDVTKRIAPNQPLKVTLPSTLMLKGTSISESTVLIESQMDIAGQMISFIICPYYMSLLYVLLHCQTFQGLDLCMKIRQIMISF